MGNRHQTDDTAAADHRSEQEETATEAADEEVEDLDVTDDEVADNVRGGRGSLGQDMDPY